jgi:SAM-dependent methyltransferase
MTWEERKQQYNKEYFDGNLPGHYSDWWWTDFAVWGPRARVVFEAFRPKSVLVCGCAKGSLVKFLVGIYGVDAYGFDLSEYAINTTPYPDIRHRLSVLDLACEALPFEEGKFDVVTCYDFLEHNDSEHIRHVCSEVCRVARKYILLRMPIVHLDDAVAFDLQQRTRGLPYADRMRMLSNEPRKTILSADVENSEHPSTLGREATIAMFQPAFFEMHLDSYYYDILMGSDPEKATPVLPFYDTIVLV